MKLISRNYTSHIRVGFFTWLLRYCHTQHTCVSSRLWGTVLAGFPSALRCWKSLECRESIRSVSPREPVRMQPVACWCLLLRLLPWSQSVYKYIFPLSLSPVRFCSVPFLVSSIETLQSGRTLFSLNSGAADALLQCRSRSRIADRPTRTLLVSTGFSSCG